MATTARIQKRVQLGAIKEKLDAFKMTEWVQFPIDMLYFCSEQMDWWKTCRQSSTAGIRALINFRKPQHSPTIGPTSSPCLSSLSFRSWSVSSVTSSSVGETLTDFLVAFCKIESRGTPNLETEPIDFFYLSMEKKRQEKEKPSSDFFFLQKNLARQYNNLCTVIITIKYGI